LQSRFHGLDFLVLLLRLGLQNLVRVLETLVLQFELSLPISDLLQSLSQHRMLLLQDLIASLGRLLSLLCCRHALPHLRERRHGVLVLA
jgi:hypothetical protein